MRKLKTGIVYDDVFLTHETGRWHPECPDRLLHAMQYLKKQSWFENLVRIQPTPATEQCLARVHTEEYIHRVREACRRGHEHIDSEDVGICPASYDVALMAAGAGLNLADALFRKEIHNGFALIRPPGHHAEIDRAMGFCLFNNIAILAKYCQTQVGIRTIGIIDWDVHHGNGSEHIFREDPSVFYASVHQYPFYPGTGSMYDIGLGDGEGTTLNCPLPAGAGDEEVQRVFEKSIIPELKKYQPDLLLISAGFDSHKDDPLAEIQLSTDMFAWMTARTMELADHVCEGRIISVLEGGYNLGAIGPSIAAHISSLMGGAS